MVTTSSRYGLIGLFLAGSWGCKPAEEGRPSLLETDRVLAVQAQPAEAAPGMTTTLNVLRAGPSGRTGTNDLSLDFCVSRKPIAAPGVVAPACLVLTPSDALVPIAQAEPTSAILPETACSLFGPKPAASEGDEALRPADPDTSGGYYQPIRVVDQRQISLFSARISCGLTGTSQETSIEYTRRYRANENPTIRKLALGRENGVVEVLVNDQPAQLQPGERVAFAVSWEKCPIDRGECGDGYCGLEETTTSCPDDCNATAACTGAETYPLLDPVTRQLRLQRENLRVSWFVTGGELTLDKSGRSSAEASHDAQNNFTAPATPGDYWLFAVIRDDRGGVGWVEQPLHVE